MHLTSSEINAELPVKRVVTIVPSRGNPLFDALKSGRDGHVKLPCTIGAHGLGRIDDNAPGDWDVLVMEDVAWKELPRLATQAGGGSVIWLKHRGNHGEHAHQRKLIQAAFPTWRIAIEVEFSHVPREMQVFLSPIVSLIENCNKESYASALSLVDRVLMQRDSEACAVQFLYSLAGLRIPEIRGDSELRRKLWAVANENHKLLAKRYDALESESCWIEVGAFLTAVQERQERAFTPVHYQELKVLLDRACNAQL